MMNFPAFLFNSIKNKLIAVIMLTVSIGLVLAGIGISAYDVYRFKQEMKNELDQLGEIVGYRCAAAIILDDPVTAGEGLQSLRAKKNIVGAAIYKDDRLFAFYRRLGTPEQLCSFAARGGEYCAFEDNFLCLAKDIIHKQQAIGRIVIRSDLRELQTRIKTFAGIIFAIFTLAAFVSFFFAFQLQKMITQPIVGLVRTAREIAEKKDYSVRATKRSTDELGILTEAFNNMLEEMDASEMALQKANEGLEKRVEERTSELKEINADLQRAKEEADAASRAKNDFLANMSHEIRTPMNGVIAAGDLALAADNLPDNIRRYLEIINNSAYSLLQVIDDILDCSKIESGNMTLEKKPFYLAEVLDRLLEIFVGKAQTKNIELLLDLDYTAPALLVGDSLRLLQILVNLVGNALKFTKTGSVVIGISSKPDDEQQIVVEFYVRDTGIGIEPERRQHLFEPFQQGDASTTRKYGGTGLGLTIAKRLVERMGGRIWFKSEPGQGSTFYFTISQVQPRILSQEISAPDIAGVRVLLVDDNPLCLDVVKKMFVPLDCRVFTATSGKDGLEIIMKNLGTEKEIELALLDWRLEGMDGVALAALLRARGVSDMAIILMSAFGRAQELSRRDASGIDIFMAKPIRRLDLFSAITTLVEQKRLRGSAAGFARDLDPGDGLRGLKVLVVDDNKTNQLVVRTILENCGMLVEVAGNGRQAVEAVMEQGYDVVLMDVQMPEMDGYEATKIIRGDPSLASLPIIAMTAHTTHEDREKCFQAGMNDYIGKPISQNMLLRVIGRMVAGTPAHDRPQIVELCRGAEPEKIGADIMALPGIDSREALARLGISQAMFEHVLSSFYNDFSDFGDTLKAAWKKDDFEDVKKLVHKLKGSSGSIGAVGLYETVSELDRLCKKDIMPDPAQIGALEISLAEVLGSIAAGISEKNEGAGEKELRAMDREHLAPALKELEQALDQALLENIRECFSLVKKYSEGREVNDLEKLIAVYQYDEAQEKLNEIREKLDL